MNEHKSQKPPIPSPFDMAHSTPKMPASRNYWAAIVMSVVFGLCEWELVGRLGIGLAGVCVMSYFWLVITVRTLLILRQGASMGWHVSQANMPQLHKLICKNATDDYVPFVVVWPFAAVSLARSEPVWVLPLVVLTVPAILWNRRVERRLQNMDVESDVANDYTLMIKAWRNARFALRNS